MKTITLMYHDIYEVSEFESGFSKRSTSQYKIPVQAFEEHVRSIVGYCKEHNDVGVEFTFDDGGVSSITLAAPILEKYGLRGCFFISTKYINTPCFLTDTQINELADRGHKIGSHSHSHPALTKLTESELADEWFVSVGKLKRYMRDHIMASIPEGYVNKAVIDKAKAAGISILYTSEPSTTMKQNAELEIRGRYVVCNDMSLADVMRIITSNRERLKLNLRWKLLCIAKAILADKYDALKARLFNRS